MPTLSSRLCCLSLLALITGCAETARDYQQPIDGDARLPTASALDLGIDATLVDALSLRLDSRECKRIDSLLLIKDGKLIFERYQNGYTQERLHDIASITKSVTSLLIGIAIDKEHIASVDEKVADFFVETPYADAWPEDKSDITIEHLLTMQHGLACDDYADQSMNEFRQWLQSDDRVVAVLQIPVNQEPGKESSYCTASTQLLQQVLAKSTGQSIEDFAQEVLFEPLGIQTFRWDSSKKHGVGMGFGADARPRDLAILGRMIEQNGKWNDRQIVAESWLSESFKRRGTLLGIDYGYLWYGESYTTERKKVQSHLAMGHGGQFLILLPELQSIIVITASDYDQEFNFYEFIQSSVLPICL